MAGLIFQVLLSSLILTSGEAEVRDAESCSVDGRCEDNRPSYHYNEQGQNGHVETFIRNATALRLLKAQTEVAKYLEIGYLAVSNFPDLSKKVRMDAHEAKTQHMMTSALMKNYMVTAVHILDTVLPLMQRAVDTEDKILFGQSLDRIRQIAGEMKQEAEEAKTEYEKISLAIQELLSNVEERSATAKKANNELQIEKEKNDHRRAEMNKEESQLEDDIDRLGETISDMRTEADKLRESIDKHSFLKRGKMLIEELVRGVASMFFGNKMTPIAKSASSLIFDSVEQLESKYKQMLNEIERRREKMSSLQKQLKSIKKEKLEIVANLQLLDLKKVRMGDVKSLAVAFAGIANTTELFDKIVMFWDNMITAIKFLKQESETEKMPVKMSQNEKGHFIDYIERAMKGWASLGKMCQFYVKKCERDDKTKISNLYKFMMYPLSMTDKERQTRMTEIASELHYTLKQEIADEDNDGNNN